jgi:hypothetical protein
MMHNSLLLIPEPGDPHGLLDMALGHFPPPFAVLFKADPEFEEEEDTWVLGSNTDLPKGSDGNFYKTVALVLIWNGEPVIEGINRLVSRSKDCETHPAWHIFINYVAEDKLDNPEGFLNKLTERGKPLVIPNAQCGWHT